MKRKRGASVNKLIEATKAFLTFNEEDQDWLLDKLEAGVAIEEIARGAEAEGRLRWRDAP